MTVLPESFPFPSPSLLLPPPRGDVVSPSGVVRRGGVCVYTPPRAALRGWGSIGTPCVATPRESINRPHTTLMERERREKRERREGKERRGEEGGKNGG